MADPLTENMEVSPQGMETTFDGDLANKFDAQMDQWFEFLKKSLSDTFLHEYVNPATIGILLIPILWFLSYLLTRGFKFLFLRYLLKYLTSLAKSRQVKENLLKVPKIVSPLFTLLALRLTLVPMETIIGFELLLIKKPMNAVLIIMAVLALRQIVSVSLGVWSDQFSQKKRTVALELLPLVSGLSTIIILGFGILFAISSLGVNITPFVASIGAFTFAVGFAVKDALGNFAAGVILIIDQTFKVGDKIQIPGIGFGHIHEISLRSTRIQTFDKEMIVVPNNVLMNKEYKNYGLPDDTIRVNVSFSVAYGSDIKKVKQVVLEILKKDPQVMDAPPPVVEFQSMGDFSLIFMAKGYIDEFQNQYDKKLELTEKIYDQLNQKKIDIPFPTHTVHIKR